jgi:hypothetical protein
MAYDKNKMETDVVGHNVFRFPPCYELLAVPDHRQQSLFFGGTVYQTSRMA